MSRRNLVVTVIGAHLCVLLLAVLFGGCAREKKQVKLTAATPVQEIRAPEGAPESILEPKGMVEEADLLVSREPEMIPAKAEAPTVAASPAVKAEAVEAKAAAARPEGAPVVPEIKQQPSVEAPKPAARTHRVAPGESLWKIGHMYGVPVAELAAANGLKPNAGVRVGQLLTLPSGAGEAVAPKGAAAEKPAGAVAEAAGGRATHVIQKGETLSKIAKRYHVSLKALIDANRIEDASKIKAGQTLMIPQ
jgi:LysM repeat protein